MAGGYSTLEKLLNYFFGDLGHFFRKRISANRNVSEIARE